MDQVTAAKTYTDFSNFSKLRVGARNNDPETIKSVAKQFESIFLQMVMKSMRSANRLFTKDSLMQSDNIEFYQDMFDNQLSLNLTENGGLGLSKVLVRQLSQNSATDTGSVDNAAKRMALEIKQPEQINTKDKDLFSNPVEFIKSLLPIAKQYAKEINMDPKLLLAQAALETAWGKKVLKAADGQTSFNLFNIKTEQPGAIKLNALEYVNGKAVNQQSYFRQYNSYAESFSDYIQLMKQSDRYQHAVSKAHDPEHFINTIHQAGYATDPNYAQKVLSIYNGETLNNAITEAAR